MMQLVHFIVISVQRFVLLKKGDIML